MQGVGATAYLAQRTPGMGLPTPALAGLLRHIRPATPESAQQVRISSAPDSLCAPVGAQSPPMCLSSSLSVCTSADTSSRHLQAEKLQISHHCSML